MIATPGKWAQKKQPQNPKAQVNSCTSLKYEPLVWLLIGVAVILLLVSAVPSLAQAPDAGQLMRQQQKATERRKPPVQPGEQIGGRSTAEKKQEEKTEVAAVEVKTFRITDDAGGLFAEEKLQALTDNFTGRKLSLKAIKEVADIVAQYYRSEGYFLAQARIPAQAVIDDVVEIHVVVGHLEGGDQILLRADNLRLNEHVVRSTIARNTRDGEPLKLAELEQGILLLNDLPGVTAKASLLPGVAPGAVRLAVDAREGALASVHMGADNHGYRHTGEERGSVYLRFNDPFEVGDSATVSAVSAGSGMNYGRLSYQRPVGYSGLVMGLSYSHLRYQLGEELESLEAEGKADSASLFARYPIVRSRLYNLSATLSFDYEALYNEASGITTSDKILQSTTLSFDNDVWDSLLGGGVTSMGLNATHGRLELDEWPLDQLVDSLTAETQGRYTKVELNLARQQRLSDSFSLYLSASGQWADKNLDSSEKFVLGGAYGVRAYPNGEASGDEGVVATAELRWQIPLHVIGGSLRVFAFHDSGRIRLHAEPWIAGALNTYHLRGSGIGAVLAKDGGFSVSATFARKVGDNPNPTATGTDSDGTDDDNRFWLQTSFSF